MQPRQLTTREWNTIADALGNMAPKSPWFWCTYHNNPCQVDEVSGELRCEDGDETYGGHCTCVGPFSTKEVAEGWSRES